MHNNVLLRRWPNIEPPLYQRLVFAGIIPNTDVDYYTALQRQRAVSAYL